MQIIGFIVEGDRTSHGGQVLECQARRSIDGINVARLGDKVWCPRCQRMTQIITSRFPQVTEDDVPTAFDMDMTDCGAQLYSRHNGHAGYALEDSPPAQSNAKAPTTSAGKTANAQEHFILHDRETGKKLAGLPYTLQLPDGQTVDGETDEAGRTSVAWTGAPEDIAVALRPQPNKSDDPYHFPEPGSEEN